MPHAESTEHQSAAGTATSTQSVTTVAFGTLYFTSRPGFEDLWRSPKTLSGVTGTLEKETFPDTAVDNERDCEDYRAGSLRGRQWCASVGRTSVGRISRCGVACVHLTGPVYTQSSRSTCTQDIERDQDRLTAQLDVPYKRPWEGHIRGR
jgi:hypothetical protein